MNGNILVVTLEEYTRLLGTSGICSETIKIVYYREYIWHLCDILQERVLSDCTLETPGKK